MARARAYRHAIRCRVAAPIGCPKTDTREVNSCTSAAIASESTRHTPRSRASRSESSGRVATIDASTIALDEMWTYWGARKAEKRNELWGWTAAVEERNGSKWIDFEVGAETMPHSCALLERLPDTERYETDAYGVYGTLLVNKHVIGKYGAVNRIEVLHSTLRRKLKRLARRTKGCAKSVDMPVNPLALVFCDKLKLNATHH